MAFYCLLSDTLTKWWHMVAYCLTVWPACFLPSECLWLFIVWQLIADSLTKWLFIVCLAHPGPWVWFDAASNLQSRKSVSVSVMHDGTNHGLTWCFPGFRVFSDNVWTFVWSLFRIDQSFNDNVRTLFWSFFRMIKAFRFWSKYRVIRNTQTTNPNQQLSVTWGMRCTCWKKSYRSWYRKNWGNIHEMPILPEVAFVVATSLAVLSQAVVNVQCWWAPFNTCNNRHWPRSSKAHILRCNGAVAHGAMSWKSDGFSWNWNQPLMPEGKMMYPSIPTSVSEATASACSPKFKCGSGKHGIYQWGGRQDCCSLEPGAHQWVSSTRWVSWGLRCQSKYDDCERPYHRAEVVLMSPRRN